MGDDLAGVPTQAWVGEGLTDTCFRATLVFVDRRNITLAIPVDLLRDAKVMAAEEHTSVSALMIEALRNAVGRRQRFVAARERQLALMGTLPLGFGGSARVTRDELHER